jgi:hypothetical protein
MGIVRTVEWSLSLLPDEAEVRLRNCLTSLGMSAEGTSGSLRAKSARSLTRNRWAADVSIDLRASQTGTVATCSVDMLGNKHFALLDEIADGEQNFDDGGVAQAIERLGKASRVFGRKELRHLRHLIRAGEKVTALGQGSYAKKQGLVVLTNERMFFFEKSLGSETVEEFGLGSVNSIEVAKKMGGERLFIHASGNRAEITQMMHGSADQIANAFRAARSKASTPIGDSVPLSNRNPTFWISSESSANCATLVC